ncbi:anti-sigma factor RsiW [Ancylobacter sp. 3268]|uniref:anti-sigma factor family protein n=1 Tax=Ancylobacter sp. 3268 TaxID=2817752 RepID=UPI00286135CB|nr:anti-sigma factor [Ancylobacter sp. 3268]MDR6953208.1 anti-sigma factor RsiW [Ancylobacter sp. 3268]
MRAGLPIGEDDLQAYVDGQLPPARIAEVETWLGERPELEARLSAYRTQREELRERLRPFGEAPIPARLRISAIRAGRRRRQWSWAMRAAAACLILAVGTGTGWWAANRFSPVAASRQALAEDPALGLAFAAHWTLATDGDAATALRTGDRRDLSSWISDRLGHDIAVPDLSSQGFRLLGARVLSSARFAAAQVAYGGAGGKHLTLYVKTGETGESRPAFTALGGVSAMMWRDDGCAYALVGALDHEPFAAVSGSVFDQMEADGS